jgi:hypothetical protein
LAQYKGHGPIFSPGDVVALALVSDLVHVFGIRVNTIASRLGTLFDECHRRSWIALEGCAALITDESARLVQADDLPRAPEDGTALLIRLQPIVARLRVNLIAAEPEDAQGQFSFPPVPVGAKAQP